jgi:hypothetical protein
MASFLRRKPVLAGKVRSVVAVPLSKSPRSRPHPGSGRKQLVAVRRHGSGGYHTTSKLVGVQSMVRVCHRFSHQLAYDRAIASARRSKRQRRFCLPGCFGFALLQDVTFPRVYSLERVTLILTFDNDCDYSSVVESSRKRSDAICVYLSLWLVPTAYSYHTRTAPPDVWASPKESRCQTWTQKERTSWCTVLVKVSLGWL